MKKIYFILFLFFIIRLFVGCCRCSNDYTTIEYQKVRILNIDGNASSPNNFPILNSDTMFNSAVAFGVSVIDTTIDYTKKSYVVELNNFGFSSANATTCDCPTLYKSTQQIVDIKIFTLEDISPTIKANTNVTDLFVAYPSKSSLYTPIDKLYPLINENAISTRPEIVFYVFCKESIQNDKAQFVINIELSDGHFFSEFTNLIHIKSSN
jgi:hypothetical protein